LQASAGRVQEHAQWVADHSGERSAHRIPEGHAGVTTKKQPGIVDGLTSSASQLGASVGDGGVDEQTMHRG